MTGMSIGLGLCGLYSGAHHTTGLNVPIGDGVTDNSSALAAWLSDAANANRTLILQPGQSYLFSSRVGFFTGSASIDLNGATVLAPKGWIQNWQRDTWSAADYLTGSAGDTAFSLSSGATSLTKITAAVIATGDVIQLWATESKPNAGGYRKGWWAQVTGVSGNTVTFSPAVPEALGIRYLRRYKPYDAAVYSSRSGGVIDCRGGGPKVAEDNVRTAVSLAGRNPVIRNVQILGDADSERGVMVEGWMPLVEDVTVSGFTDEAGLSGGGRLGYGVDLGGYAPTARRVTGSSCKHVITCATSRDNECIYPVIEDCIVSSPTGASAETVTISSSPQPRYQGMIDQHGNVRLGTVRRNTISGVNMAIAARAPVVIEDNVISISAATTLFAQHLTVCAYEGPMDISGSGNSITAPSSCWAFGIQGYAAVTPSAAHGDLVLDDTAISGCNLLTLLHDNNASVSDVTLGDLIFTGTTGSGVAGISIVGNAVYRLGGIGTVTLAGPAAFSGTAVHLQYITGYDDPIVGPDLLTNGDFASGTGWTLGNTGGTAASSISGGLLNLTGDGTNTGYASQAISVTNGATYRLEWDTASAATTFRVGTAFLGQQMVAADNKTGSSHVDFAATGTTAYVSARRQSAGSVTVAGVSLHLLT